VKENVLKLENVANCADVEDGDDNVYRDFFSKSSFNVLTLRHLNTKRILFTFFTENRVDWMCKVAKTCHLYIV
jgi:hypothetical protein